MWSVILSVNYRCAVMTTIQLLDSSVCGPQGGYIIDGLEPCLAEVEASIHIDQVISVRISHAWLCTEFEILGAMTRQQQGFHEISLAINSLSVRQDSLITASMDLLCGIVDLFNALDLLELELNHNPHMIEFGTVVSVWSV